MKQLTFFDVIPDFEPNDVSESMIEKIILTGSNRRYSMDTIAARLISGYENIPDFLKREFGTGGKGMIIDGERYSVWFDKKGIRFATGPTAKESNNIWSWKALAEHYTELYQNGNFNVGSNAYNNTLKRFSEALELHFRDAGILKTDLSHKKKWGDRIYICLQEDCKKIKQMLYNINNINCAWYIDRNNALYIQIYEELFCDIPHIVRQIQEEQPHIEIFINEDVIKCAIEKMYFSKKEQLQNILLANKKSQNLAIKRLFGVGGQSPFLTDNDFIWENHNQKGITLTDTRNNNICNMSYIKLLKEINKIVEKDILH